MWHRRGTSAAGRRVLIGGAFAMLALSGCAVLAADGAPGVRLGKSANDPDAGIVLAQAQTGVESAAQPAAISPYLGPAPEIFEATGRARWDGKRTLQGVWVAHPAAQTARRVRIFNTANGRAVDGALFKRDTGDGKDAVLISSEAAQLLGIEPGTATEIRIVAVTPVDNPVAAAPAPAPAETPASEAEAPAPAPEAARVDEPQVPAEPEVPAPATVVAEPAPASEPETAVAAAPADPAPADPAPADEPQPADPPEAADEPVVAPKDDTTFRWEQPPETPETPGPAEAPTAEDKPEPPAQTAAASTLVRPFIQAGTFGVASNAANLVARLEKLGIPAQSRKQTAGGRQLTRVLAGPFQTQAERDAAQRRIRGMGMRDAVPVRR